MKIASATLSGSNSRFLVITSVTAIAVWVIAGYWQSFEFSAPTTAKTTLDETSSSLPFIANEGQIDAEVAFYTRTFAGDVFVTDGGALVYSLPIAASENSVPDGRWTVVETWIGGRPQIIAERASDIGVSFFQGNDPAEWRSDVATYKVVSFGEVWSGIDVNLSAHSNNIEKILEVAPGADTADIRVRIDGATTLSVSNDGALVAATEGGELRFSAPKAWQEVGGKKTTVEVAYAVNGHEYGFTVGEYDPAMTLMIDPLLQSTYLGSGDWAEENAVIALNPINSDVYVAYHQLFDSNIARLSADLTALAAGRRFAGDISFTNDVLAIAVHPIGGDVYVAGVTDAPTFTGTAGGIQPAPAGGLDGFVIRFSQDLGAVIQATYFGGSGNDELEDMIFSDTGAVYVAGTTSSSDFPGTAGGALPTSPTGANGFLARLSADLTTLDQATYLGGSVTEDNHALAYNSILDVIYVAGETNSADIPGTTGGAQPAIAGTNDIYITRLSSDLTAIEQSTYLGGGDGTGGFEEVPQLAIDSGSGQVYVAGLTRSTDFPGTTGGAQPALAGGVATDAFVARLTADLSTLSQATYLGGAGSSEASPGLAFHPVTGEVYVAGTWGSATADFPGTDGGAQPAPGGDRDAFTARLSGDLTLLVQATYLGGGFSEFIFTNDEPINVKVHPITGEVYVAGITASQDFPGTAGGAVPTSPGGVAADNVFIARFDTTLEGELPSDSTPDPFTFIDQTGVPLSTLIDSNAVTITGIDTPAGISIVGGEYSIDGGAFTTASGTVDADSNVMVRVLSSSQGDTQTSATLTVGGVSDSFDVRTLIIAVEGAFKGKGGGSTGALELLWFSVLLLLSRTVRKSNRIMHGAPLFVMVVALMLGASPQTAQADGSYAGFSGGWTQGDFDADDLRRALEPPFSVGSISIDNNDFGYKIFVGYEFQEYWAVELAFVDLGEISSEFRVTFPPDELDDVLNDSSRSHGFLANGWAISGVGEHSFNQTMSIFGKLGLFTWNADIEVAETSSGSRVKLDDSGTGLVLGAGLRYRWSSEWGVRLEWERYDVNEWADFVSLGVEFRF